MPASYCQINCDMFSDFQYSSFSSHKALLWHDDVDTWHSAGPAG